MTRQLPRSQRRGCPRTRFGHFDLIAQEGERQRVGLELIASENFTSAAVMEPPGQRADQQVRRRVIRANASTAAARSWTRSSSSPSSGSRTLWRSLGQRAAPFGLQANLAVYNALLEARRHRAGHGPVPRRTPDPRQPGELLGLRYNIVWLQGESGNRTDRHGRGAPPRALEHKPKMIIAGASAYCRTIDFATLSAKLPTKSGPSCLRRAHIAGLVAAGLHPNPFPTPMWSPAPPTKPCAVPVAG